MISRLITNLGPDLLDAESWCLAVDDWLVGQILEGHRFAVGLLLREALTNAILHGSAAGGEPCVQASIAHHHHWLAIRVTDQGPGFPWQEQILHEADPTIPGKRGMLIYRTYADDVRFNPKGNDLLLRRRLYTTTI